MRWPLPSGHVLGLGQALAQLPVGAFGQVGAWLAAVRPRSAAHVDVVYQQTLDLLAAARWFLAQWSERPWLPLCAAAEQEARRLSLRLETEAQEVMRCPLLLRLAPQHQAQTLLDLRELTNAVVDRVAQGQGERADIPPR